MRMRDMTQEWERGELTGDLRFDHDKCRETLTHTTVEDAVLCMERDPLFDAGESLSDVIESGSPITICVFERCSWSELDFASLARSAAYNVAEGIDRYQELACPDEYFELEEPDVMDRMRVGIEAVLIHSLREWKPWGFRQIGTVTLTAEQVTEAMVRENPQWFEGTERDSRD